MRSSAAASKRVASPSVHVSRRSFRPGRPGRRSSPLVRVGRPGGHRATTPGKRDRRQCAQAVHDGARHPGRPRGPRVDVQMVAVAQEAVEGGLVSGRPDGQRVVRRCLGAPASGPGPRRSRRILGLTATRRPRSTRSPRPRRDRRRTLVPDLRGAGAHLRGSRTREVLQDAEPLGAVDDRTSKAPAEQSASGAHRATPRRRGRGRRRPRRPPARQGPPRSRHGRRSGYRGPFRSIRSRVRSQDQAAGRDAGPAVTKTLWTSPGWFDDVPRSSRTASATPFIHPVDVRLRRVARRGC